MRIGCLQFAPKVGDVANNLNRADEVLNKADPFELDLLVLPELAFSGNYNFHIAQYPNGLWKLILMVNLCRIQLQKPARNISIPRTNHGRCISTMGSLSGFEIRLRSYSWISRDGRCYT